MALDVGEALKRINSVEKEEASGGDLLRNLINNVNNRHKVIRIEGDPPVEIRIKPLMDRKLRHYINDVSEKIEGDLEKSEDLMYEVLSKMCLDDDFRTPEMWQALDEEYGIASEVMELLFEENRQNEKKIKTFR
jgi:hypothetical protein